MSLNDLRNATQGTNSTLKDRSASREDMDKLKDLISQKVSVEVEHAPELVKLDTNKKEEIISTNLPKNVPIVDQNTVPVSTPKIETPSKVENTKEESTTKVNEVPEHVLRKILE